jgi:hypothetical protein
VSDERVERALAEIRRAGLEEALAVSLCPMAYVVTRGSYSDYRICGVFLDKARAEAHADRLNADSRGDGADVEEWPLVGADGVMDPGVFEASIGIDGSGRAHWEEDKHLGPPRATVQRTDPVYFRHTEEPIMVRFYGHGRTEEHARRSAEQLRREWLAAGYTPESYLAEKEGKQGATS